MNNKKQLHFAALLTLPVMILLWEVVSRLFFNKNIFPPPTIVFLAFIEMMKSGELINDTLISLFRAFVGFAISAVAGILCGVLTGRVLILRKTLGQVIELIRPIPAIAFLPLFILWFGIGEESKILLIAYGCFFPIWINTHVGVSNVEKTYIWAAKSLGADKKSLLIDVIIPSATPFILTGLRTSIGIAFILLVVAEMAGAFAGLGFRISISHLVFRTDKMLVGIIMLGVLGAASHKLFIKFANKVVPWYETK